MKPPPRRVFFEPWSLGDAIIAAATIRELNEPAILACHSAWHPLLRRVLQTTPTAELRAVDLPYTTRTRATAFDTGTFASSDDTITEVLSIRGDFRDYLAARRLFPRARIRMNGWVRFFGRKSALINFSYGHGWRPAQNRYRSWAQLLGIPFSRVETKYWEMRATAPHNPRVVFHVGAQWRSKQYPHVRELRTALRDRDFDVTILAGSGDKLPADLEESEITRAVDGALVDQFQSASYVITNDSGPMHVAAFLGCRTTALVRTSPIEEWAPPGVSIVRSSQTPIGYRPHPRYMSDESLPGWPSIEAVVQSLRAAISPTPSGK